MHLFYFYIFFTSVATVYSQILLSEIFSNGNNSSKLEQKPLAEIFSNGNNSLKLEQKPLAGCMVNKSTIPTKIYENLGCVPNYNKQTHCLENVTCPKFELKTLCVYKGQIYRIGDTIDPSDLIEVGDVVCKCDPYESRPGYESATITCEPSLISMDTCREDWTIGTPSQGCYLGHDLKRPCNSTNICPPFENITTCQVGNTIYKERQLIPHPTERCIKCICDKGFDNKYEPPFCSPINCTTSLLQSYFRIKSYCAPLYADTKRDCCPEDWIFSGEFIKTVSIPDDINQLLGWSLGCNQTETFGRKIWDHPYFYKSFSQCRFGYKMYDIGSRITTTDELFHPGEVFTCECVYPPFMHCRKDNGTFF